MKVENQNASERLQKQPRAVSWELALLLVLLVTVLGVALRAPVKSFPSAHDPYDLRGERVISGARNRVETGI